MTVSFILLQGSSDISRALVGKLIGKLCPSDSVVESLGDSSYKLTLAGGGKALVAFQASFAAVSSDLYGGLTALVIPALKDSFLPYLRYATPGKIAYLFEAADKHPEIYEECQTLLDDIDSETLFTIKTYIETERSPSLSALRLYVHRNTVAYRLSRFEEETGLTIDSFGNERFVYELIRRRKLNLEEGYI
jgi:hypothetical protein